MESAGKRNESGRIRGARTRSLVLKPKLPITPAEGNTIDSDGGGRPMRTPVDVRRA